MAAYTYGVMGEPPIGKIIQGTGHYAGPGTEEEAYDLFTIDNPNKPLVKARNFNVGVNHDDYSIPALLAKLEEVNAAGAIPNIGISMRDYDNPDNLTNAIDDVVANTNTYDSVLAQIVETIRLYDKPSYVAIGFEFNNSGGYHAHDYVKAYNKIWTAIRMAGGGGKKAAFQWVYEPSGPADYYRNDAAGYYWWPGDDKIDWYGLDVFQADPYLTAGTPTYIKERNFLIAAADHGRPVFLREAEPGTLDILPESGGNGDTYIALWYSPFFAFMDLFPVIKGWCYINHDYGASTPLSGDHQLITNEVVLAWYQAKIAESKYLDYTHAGELFSFETEFPVPGAGNPDGPSEPGSFRFDRKGFFGDRPHSPPKQYKPQPIPNLRMSRR